MPDPPSGAPEARVERPGASALAGNAVSGRSLVTSRLVLPSLAPLIAFCVLWRVPGLDDPPWLNDEGVYAAVGAALLRGELLYRQVWENKPPAIYLLNAAGELLAGSDHILIFVRLAALVASIITQVAIYALLRTQRGHGTALLGAAFAGILIDLPLIDGLQANAETFLIAATSTAMAVLVRVLSTMSTKDIGRRSTPVGIALGVAILFKLVGAMDVLAAVLVLLLWPEKDWPLKRRALAGILSGIALPLLLIAVWFAGSGLLGDALYATVGYNRSYVSTGQSLHTPLVTILEWSAIALIALGAALLYSRTRVRRTQPALGAMAAAWLALALLGTISSGRLYPHYFLQIVPSLAICLALATSDLMDRYAGYKEGSDGQDSRAARVLAALLVLWGAGVPLVSVVAASREPARAAAGSDPLGYYAHFWRYLTGAISGTAYGNAVDARVERNVAAAAYLRAHAPTGTATLYVWGNAPWIYYLSGYQHAARFLSAYYNPPIPGGMDQTARQLAASPPSYIVLIEPALPANTAIAALLAADYLPVRHLENAVVFRKREITQHSSRPVRPAVHLQPSPVRTPTAIVGEHRLANVETRRAQAGRRA